MAQKKTYFMEVTYIALLYFFIIVDRKLCKVSFYSRSPVFFSIKYLSFVPEKKMLEISNRNELA